MNIDKESVANHSEQALYCEPCDRLFIGISAFEVEMHYRKHKLNHED